MNFCNTANLNLESRLRESYGSVDVLIGRAKKGELSCQIDLGDAYSEGVEGFVEKDTEKAIGWLDTAIQNGCFNPYVLLKLGELLGLTREPHNQRKAYDLYHKAARLGSTCAQLNLAEMYRCGVEGVVNKDIKEAFEWYKKAAGESTVEYNTERGTEGLLIAGTTSKMGNAVVDFRQDALTQLYANYLVGDCPEGKPQPTKAVHYLTRAAELGNTEAQLNLGKIYLDGDCEQSKDLKKAKRWLEKASAGGNAVALELLQQSKMSDDKGHDASEVSTEAFKQALDIMTEKFSQRATAAKHPLAISNPVAFSEEMLHQYDWSPTARIYLQAYKLVKNGLEVLKKSNFTDERGITLIAHGYLTENSIFQAFPMIYELSSHILQLCREILIKKPGFFEGLLLSYALQGIIREKISDEQVRSDSQKIICIMNLINFIHKAEPNSLPCEHPFEFDKNYSSWLHVLYEHLASLYTISGAIKLGAEAAENSVKWCTAYCDAKRALGYLMMLLYVSRNVSEREDSSHQLPEEFLRLDNQQPHEREISKYDSWTAEKLRDTAVKVLKEYLVEAPPCYKTYPNACYYLANIHFLEGNRDEFRKYFELGQDAEEKRLPFLDPINLPLKDGIAPYYQLFVNVKIQPMCGNKACTKKVREHNLKFCGQCGMKKYCSKECQKADWKNHKPYCTATKKLG
ncbi:uncharacterized protein LOC111330888 [Stylophora pistillata]|uniref:uncharacterized protein LOC111330888 n=1 Tax=Stylophora pistillata TaxID=50429 RepID=UPI000C055037|nr:uncharacterized protein LOC111330888 [Stylophora pistillata]